MWRKGEGLRSMAGFGVAEGGSAARSSLSVALPQAGGAMCGYHGKRRARSLTGGVDSLLDVRGESVVLLASLPSGDLQGDGVEGVLVPRGVATHHGGDVCTVTCHRWPPFHVRLSCYRHRTARQRHIPQCRAGIALTPTSRSCLLRTKRLSRCSDLLGEEMRPGWFMWLLGSVDQKNRVVLFRSA